MAPAPPIVRLFAPAFTAPEIVSVPAVAVILVGAAIVTPPLRVVVLLAVFRKAPPFAMPVPLSVSGSAIAMDPLTWSAAPLETTVLPVVAPSAVAFEAASAPPETVVTPA